MGLNDRLNTPTYECLFKNLVCSFCCLVLVLVLVSGALVLVCWCWLPVLVLVHAYMPMVSPWPPSLHAGDSCWLAISEYVVYEGGR